MNKNISNIFIVLNITIFSAILYKNYNLYDNIIVFISGLIMFTIITKFLYYLKPKFITKDADEILHPVVESTTTILHICNIEKHYGKMFQQKYIEKCSCGSTLFRIYNEDTEKGTYTQFICSKCNQKATGLEFNWKQKI